jgi:6-phosphogluconolactonase
MKIIRFADKDAWIKETSIIIERFLAKHAESVLTLSGGSTPYPVYDFVSLPPGHHIHITQVDERVVHPSSTDSNQNHILQAIPPKENPKANFHMIPVEKGWKSATKAYRHTLDNLEELPRLTILGIGNDGHFASIFPQTDDILPDFQRKDRVIATTAPDYMPVRERISLTTEFILESDQIIILVGPDKADTLKKIQLPNTSSYDYPAKILEGYENVTVYTYPFVS